MTDDVLFLTITITLLFAKGSRLSPTVFLRWSVTFPKLTIIFKPVIWPLRKTDWSHLLIFTCIASIFVIIQILIENIVIDGLI